jgi:pSer/pThr/pTyr-binding forkhead associated (FHA) protein
MDFELVVVQGRSATNTIKLSDGVTVVGRHNDCQLRIKSSQVSRKHCEIFEKKGLLLVKDLNSSNGTIVNGKRVQGQRVLEEGDELTIGPVLLRVAKIAAGAAAPAAVAVKASDTAVTAAIAGDDEVEVDDFTVDIDEPTQAAQAPAKPAPAAAASAPPKAKAKAPDDDDFADFLLDIPVHEEEAVEENAETEAVPLAAATPEAKPAPKAATEPAKKPEPEPEPKPTPAAGEHDDAIADFLLDIQIDDDE